MTQAAVGTVRPILVSPGPAVMIGTVTAGSLIYNLDPASAVWVGPDPSTAPIHGMRIGPLGSITWQYTGNVWSVVDTGVTSPVSLVVSDQVTNPQSPLDVAEALISQGVPSKLVTTYVGSDVIFASPTVTYVQGLSGYASIFLYVVWQTTSPWPKPITYQWQVQDSSGNWRFVGQPDTLNVNDAGYIPGIVLPVLGDRIVFNNPNTYPGTVSIWGSNRAIANIPLGGGYQSAGCTWAATIVNATAGSHTLPLTSGNVPQGLGWFSCVVAYAAAFTGGYFAFQLDPAGYPGTGPTLIHQTQVQVMTQPLAANQEWIVSFLTVFPAAATDLSVRFSSAPPAGNTIVTASFIPSGGF